MFAVVALVLHPAPISTHSHRDWAAVHYRQLKTKSTLPTVINLFHWISAYTSPHPPPISQAEWKENILWSLFHHLALPSTLMHCFSGDVHLLLLQQICMSPLSATHPSSPSHPLCHFTMYHSPPTPHLHTPPAAASFSHLALRPRRSLISLPEIWL